MNKIIDICLRINNRFKRYYEEMYLHYKFRRFGMNIPRSTIFYGEPIFRIKNPKSVKFGSNIVLCSDCSKNDIGINHPVVISCLTNEAVVEIGDNTGISGASIVAMHKVRIGKYCLIGANAMILDNDLHPIEPRNRRFSKKEIKCKEIDIEDNVFIGANSIILKGVKIGENSVIQANSVVVSDIDANSIYGGNPCKKIKDLKK